jgi:hypothetical protein
MSTNAQNVQQLTERPDADLIPVRQLPSLIPSSHGGKVLSVGTLYRWIAAGKLKTRKIGGGRFVTADDLAKFLEGEPERPMRSSNAASPPRRPSTVKAGEQLDQILGSKGGKR